MDFRKAKGPVLAHPFSCSCSLHFPSAAPAFLSSFCHPSRGSSYRRTQHPSRTLVPSGQIPLLQCASTMGGIPRPLRVVGSAAAVLLGGFMVATLGAAAVYGSVRKSEDAKRRKSSLPCGACKGKGFYACKLCKGESTIQWSPLYDPVAINPCLCPTCDGKKVQRCLNCLGRGYA